MSARLVSFNGPPHLPALAVKVSSGKVAEKGIDYYLEWPKQSNQGLLCDYLREAAEKYPSVLEHLVFTFYVECSRVCSHQLVRHRLASYTQESLRYSEATLRRMVLRACEALGEACPERPQYSVDYARYPAILRILTAKAMNAMLSGEEPREAIEVAEEAFVIPENLKDPERGIAALTYLSLAAIFYDLVSEGVSVEDARYVLPQAVKTRLLMTVNLRELLHIARLRTSKHAHWEIRRVVKSMVKEAAKVIPCIERLVEAYRG